LQAGWTLTLTGRRDRRQDESSLIVGTVGIDLRSHDITNSRHTL